MVVEIWAAVAGASIGVAASGLKGANRENQELFSRISELEMSVARLEGHQNRV